MYLLVLTWAPWGFIVRIHFDDIRLYIYESYLCIIIFTRACLDQRLIIYDICIYISEYQFFAICLQLLWNSERFFGYCVYQYSDI